ncbi:hypothetical protein C2I19_17835 [Chromobacterium alticapitis]|uniref:Uncharacterized protein n=2 Tax=Chromobacterium alticapitis TaxID=2073169 RepID=A0A2S5DC28_9NEIS|nr:hypothetical protein C2I19_17835 [Chromobacterium alticapitis]
MTAASAHAYELKNASEHLYQYAEVGKPTMISTLKPGQDIKLTSEIYIQKGSGHKQIDKFNALYLLSKSKPAGAVDTVRHACAQDGAAQLHAPLAQRDDTQFVLMDKRIEAKFFANNTPDAAFSGTLRDNAASCARVSKSGYPLRNNGTRAGS